MAYARENSIPFQAVGAAGAAVTATSGTPGANSRLRLRYVAVTLSAAPAAAVTVTISDTVTTWTLDVPATGPLALILSGLDLQMAAGKAISVSVAAPAGTVVARVNAYAVYE